ncbi:MAG: heme exporter protein CcmB [Ignavibacteriae bacterium]|nr:heme exporter protein CcmB [Ignavibacteriota bacterium]
MVAPSFALFVKEFRSEVRTRYALNALFMFVITTLAIILFAIGNENASPEILSGVLWIIIFFSTMSGLSRTFISEEESGTAATLQLIARPLTVYVGKLFFNIVLLAGMNLLTIALYLVFITNFTVRNYEVFFLTMLLGTLGLAATSTILAAIIAKANTKGTLYPVLSFPILLPLLLSVINATKISVEGGTFPEAFSELQVLISYLVVILTVSYLVFDYIWKD